MQLCIQSRLQDIKNQIFYSNLQKLNQFYQFQNGQQGDKTQFFIERRRSPFLLCLFLKVPICFGRCFENRIGGSENSRVALCRIFPESGLSVSGLCSAKLSRSRPTSRHGIQLAKVHSTVLNVLYPFFTSILSITGSCWATSTSLSALPPTTPRSTTILARWAGAPTGSAPAWRIQSVRCAADFPYS